ncbi:hypothetical protein HPB51_028325 [Rhipicephalus microplus]|uniref:Uncharacterized protein n=1 Tax=Rhipicephalus microplus TaxID=6941 RepID=A0A9J6CY48_RHIMP|nr:hypothetical protein HPB51_028325 [Rhipicephalus microplus]
MSLSSYTSLFVLMFQVCEHHFLESDFVDYASYTDTMTGKVIEVPLKLGCLKPSAIPSVFSNCPAHLSRQETSARESPEEKRARLDAEALREAVRLSEHSHEADEKKNVIATFEDLFTAVGDLSLTDFWTKVVTQKQVLFLNFSDQVMDDDVKEKEKMLSAITYVAGYCAYAAFRKLAYSSCQENLTVENRTIELDDDVLIANATRGGMKFPQAVVANVVLTKEIVLYELRSPKYASQFSACAKQKEILVSLATSLVEYNEYLDVCDDGHSPELVLIYVLSAAANTLLNNLCKVQNNKLNESKAAKRNKVENKGTESKAAKRKLSTLQA